MVLRPLQCGGVPSCLLPLRHVVHDFADIFGRRGGVALAETAASLKDEPLLLVQLAIE